MPAKKAKKKSGKRKAAKRTYKKREASPKVPKGPAEQAEPYPEDPYLQTR